MKKFLFFILNCCFISAFGQTETDIRDHYQDVNKRIQESKKQDMDGPLYCNEWLTNTRLKSWPDISVFQQTTDFWYDEDPNSDSAKKRGSKTVLLKVLVLRRTAQLVTSEEYLYKDGNLVFYYSHETEEGQQWETRIWFNAKGMFKSNVKANDKEITAKELASPGYGEYKPEPLRVQKAGKKYQDLFVKDMVYQ